MGGVQRFFSGGSHGTIDERRPSDHESRVSETGQSRQGDEPMDTESGRNGSDGNVAELLNNSSGGGYASTNGRENRSSTCGCGHSEATSKNLHHTDLFQMADEQVRSTATMVADSNSGGEFPILDRELLESGSGGGNCSSGGCGYSEKTGETNRTRSTGSTVHELLAVEVSARSDGREFAPSAWIQPAGSKQRQYDHNPRVADYESPMEVFEIWLNS